MSSIEVSRPLTAEDTKKKFEKSGLRLLSFLLGYPRLLQDLPDRTSMQRRCLDRLLQLFGSTADHHDLESISALWLQNPGALAGTIAWNYQRQIGWVLVSHARPLFGIAFIQ